MPIYEYCCDNCGHTSEDLEKSTAPQKKTCPSCRRRTFKRLVSRSAFHLKGTGWYVTDFKDGAKKKTEKKTEQTKDTDKTKTEPAPADSKKKSSEGKKKPAKTVNKTESVA